MSTYPQAIDNDKNLYLVHDFLRLVLAEDYHPGDTIITVNPDPIFNKFPPTGLITLTEQCSDIQLRAISFSYTGKGNFTFTGLTLLNGFIDNPKPKRVTDVTMNVMAEHHDSIKDALIAVEDFVGVKGDITTAPLQGTMEARINFLRKLVLKPRSWFTADKRIGIVPLCVSFTDFSTREPNFWTWDFGDGNIVSISRTQAVTSGNISKCYFQPGIYSVSLTTQNDIDTNAITFPSYITARIAAPNPATITFTPDSQQIYQNGVLRSRINHLIEIMISSTGQQPLDPITSWTWNLDDDLEHGNFAQTQASYGIGGIYNVEVTAKTSLGAYRATVFPSVIDVVERLNIWHMIFDPTTPAGAVTGNMYVYEFGLLSETYKAANVSSTLAVTRDPTFLTGQPNYNQQFREFRRNNGFAPRTLTFSGDGGAATVFWAKGAANTSIQQNIQFMEWNGLANTWSTPMLSNGTSQLARQWNWVPLVSPTDIYLVLGSPGPSSFSGSPTNQTFADVSLFNYSVSNISFSLTNYLNGADELMQNVGGSAAGNFSVYRSAWFNSTGYIVRNDGVGSFFRLKSFYATQGTVGSPLQSIRKLTDIPGVTKFEGQLVTLSDGVYFFNNTGEVVVYSPSSNTWSIGGPGANSPVFGALQDTSVVGFDDPTNTLIATSDQSTNAYLFFDYSTKAQVKFNQSDLTFTSLPVRPKGEQFLAGLY